MSICLVLAAPVASVAWVVAAVATKLTGVPECIAVMLRKLDEETREDIGALLEVISALGVVDVLAIVEVEFEVEDDEVESLVDVAWSA